MGLGQMNGSNPYLNVYSTVTISIHRLLLTTYMQTYIQENTVYDGKSENTAYNGVPEYNTRNMDYD